MLTVQTILLCFLCGRPHALVVSLFHDASLGAPRYWCSRCTSPRTFAKRLRERLAKLESQGAPLLGDYAEVWNALAKLLAIEEERVRSLAA
jgi:hypothetical protein